MSFKLFIFDDRPKEVAAMESVFRDLALISVHKADKMLYSLPPPIYVDVLYLPLHAAERWGSKPLVHKSSILPTTIGDQEKGIPPFIVTGTCLAPDDPRGSFSELNILLTAVFNAIRAFNCSSFTLHSVGFWGFNLLKGETPLELRSALLKAAPELMTST